jgi:hypothetical protein
MQSRFSRFLVAADSAASERNRARPILPAGQHQRRGHGTIRRSRGERFAAPARRNRKSNFLHQPRFRPTLRVCATSAGGFPWCRVVKIGVLCKSPSWSSAASILT